VILGFMSSKERKRETDCRSKMVFVDTSGWYALVDKNDPDHPQARRWFERNRLPLITTDYVFDETLTLVRTSLGHREAVAFGKKLLASRLARLIAVTKEDREKAWGLFQRYDDKVLSFTDCTSFAVMERLGIVTAFTMDHDFEVLGYIMVP